MTATVEPGIVSLQQSGRTLSTHFSLDLFEDDGNGNKVLSLGSGTATFSNGFSASLGQALINDPTLQLSLSGTSVSVEDSVENLLQFAKAIEELGLDPAGVLGGPSAKVVIRESDPTKLNQLLNGQNFALFNLLDEVVVPEGTTLRIPLDKYDPSLSFPGVEVVNVYGTVEEYDDFNGSLTGAQYDFYVLDKRQNYVVFSDGGDFNAGALGQVDGFLLSDTVANLIAADLGSGVLQSIGAEKFQARDDVAAITAGLQDATATGLDAMGIDSLVLVDSVFNLSGTNSTLDAEVGSRLHDVQVVSSYSSLSSSSFTTGYLPLASYVVVKDLASNFPSLDTSPFFLNNNPSPNEFLVEVGTLYLTPANLIALGLNAYDADDAGYGMQLSVEQVGQLIGFVEAGNVLAKLFPDGLPSILIIDTAENLQPVFDSGLTNIPPELAPLLTDVQLTSGDLVIPAELFSSGGNYWTISDAASTVYLQGDVATVLDPGFDPSSHIFGPGNVEILVKDDASTIRSNYLDLGGVIEGFDASYRHLVDVDDVASPLVSFANAVDWFEFSPALISSGNQVDIAGEGFDVAEDGGAVDGPNDVLDISAVTNLDRRFDGADWDDYYPLFF